MSDNSDTYKKETVVVLSEDAKSISTSISKTRRFCTFQRFAVTAAISLTVSGLFSQVFYAQYKLVKSNERLIAKVSYQEKQLAELKDYWLDQFNEFDDPYTANEKLIRKYRHRKKSTSNFDCVKSSRSEECQYSSRLAFFYSSHDVLERSKKFKTVVKPKTKSQCDEELEYSITGQLWCNNSQADDSFINTFSNNYTYNPDIRKFEHLTPARVMGKEGWTNKNGWTDISRHENYGLIDGTEITVKQSGIYMIFARVIFYANVGSTISFALRNKGHILDRCHVPSIDEDGNSYEQCPTFTVAYLNSGSTSISMTISAFTRFLIGETNFYVGLYQIMPFESPAIATPNTTITPNE